MNYQLLHTRDRISPTQALLWQFWNVQKTQKTSTGNTPTLTTSNTSPCVPLHVSTCLSTQQTILFWMCFKESCRHQQFPLDTSTCKSSTKASICLQLSLEVKLTHSRCTNHSLTMVIPGEAASSRWQLSTPHPGPPGNHGCDSCHQDPSV